MKKALQIAAIGAIIIVLYDTIAAIISIGTGISYGWFSLGSFVIYLLFGFLTGRVSLWYLGALTGALIAVAESTIGWAVSWSIGPGRPTEEMNIAVLIIGAILLVVPIGAITGLIGGLASLMSKPNA